MQYTKFGNSGMQVSRFCLGTMTFGSKLDASAAGRVLDEALDSGVNFIDTADSYGESEQLLGKLLTPVKRASVFLATKVFFRYCRHGLVGRNSRVNILNNIERSLRLLQTDYVDLYQLHHPDPETPLAETLTTLDTLVRQGKVRYVGVSNHYAWQMASMLAGSAAHGWEPLISLQANYDIFDRQIEMETVPFCREFNVAMLCYSPLCGGILTGKYQTGIPKGSRAESSKKMQGYLQDQRLQVALRDLQQTSNHQQLKMSQLAILWLLAKPYVTSIVLGGSKRDHFTQLYDIADRDLPSDVVAHIDALSDFRVFQPYRNQPITDAPGGNRLGALPQDPAGGTSSPGPP